MPPLEPLQNDYWFPAKRYGWGWGPPTKWQGWVVMLLFIAAMLAVGFLIPPDRHPLGFFGSVLLCTGAIIAICWLKGRVRALALGKLMGDVRAQDFTQVAR